MPSVEVLLQHPTQQEHLLVHTREQTAGTAHRDREVGGEPGLREHHAVEPVAVPTGFAPGFDLLGRATPRTGRPASRIAGPTRRRRRPTTSGRRGPCAGARRSSRRCCGPRGGGSPSSPRGRVPTAVPTNERRGRRRAPPSPALRGWGAAGTPWGGPRPLARRRRSRSPPPGRLPSRGCGSPLRSARLPQHHAAARLPCALSPRGA